MGPDVPPAIVRDFRDVDNGLDVIHTPYDSVSMSPGLGESGYRVEVVEHVCPSCKFDRMVRRVDVSPETPMEVRYWCLNPNCGHFVDDMLSYACHHSAPQFIPQSPAVTDDEPTGADPDGTVDVAHPETECVPSQ